MYLTRNQAYRKVPWVRIPPSPPKTQPRIAGFCFWWTGMGENPRGFGLKQSGGLFQDAHSPEKFAQDEFRAIPPFVQRPKAVSVSVDVL